MALASQSGLAAAASTAADIAPSVAQAATTPCGVPVACPTTTALTGSFRLVRPSAAVVCCADGGGVPAFHLRDGRCYPGVSRAWTCTATDATTAGNTCRVGCATAAASPVRTASAAPTTLSASTLGGGSFRF